MTFDRIRKRTYFYTKTNSSSYSDDDMTGSMADAQERLALLVLKNDKVWQWDDFNNSDLPIGTTSLTSGQQDYSLAATHFTIDRVEVQDAQGNWYELNQFNQQALKRGRQTALPAYQPTTGRPLEYRLVGNSIFLYPIPNYSAASALRIYYTRGPLEFDYTTGKFTDGTGSTSSSPGFVTLAHGLLPLYMSEDFCLVNKPELLTGIQNKIMRIENDVAEFYGQRDHDFRGRFTTSNTGSTAAPSGVIGTYGADSNK